MTIPLPAPPAASLEFLSEYTLGRQLGKGAFGEVLECTHNATGRRLACKRIDKRLIASDADAAEVRKEVTVLQQLTTGPGRHGGIVQLVEAREDHGAVYLLMELCDSGDLFDLIKARHPTGMPEPMAREIFEQVAAAMAYCHARGVLHRDIKPENILFTSTADTKPAPPTAQQPTAADASPAPDSCDPADWSGRVRLADFGLALLLPPSQTGHGVAGSRFYTAPEMVRGRRYGKRADVWSLGVVLCAMLTGRVPFAGRDRTDAEGLKRSIMRGAVNFNAPSWANVSEGAQDLVARMLEVDPRGRLKAHEVLQHPWMHQEQMNLPEQMNLHGMNPNQGTFAGTQAQQQQQQQPGEMQQQRTVMGQQQPSPAIAAISLSPPQAFLTLQQQQQQHHLRFSPHTSPIPPNAHAHPFICTHVQEQTRQQPQAMALHCNLFWAVHF